MAQILTHSRVCEELNPQVSQLIRRPAEHLRSLHPESRLLERDHTFNRFRKGATR